MLNVFRMPGWYLIDLPGYGYARAAKTNRAGFRSLVESYVRSRSGVAGIVWLLDIRHPPSKEDVEFQNMLIQSERPVLATLTKSDKFPSGQRARAILERAAELGLDPEELQVTSAETGLGIADLARAILAVVTP